MNAARTKEELMTPGIADLALHEILPARCGKVAAEAIVAEVGHDL